MRGESTRPDTVGFTGLAEPDHPRGPSVLRTHEVGTLRADHAGQSVTLTGLEAGPTSLDDVFRAIDRA